jgi:hypothetical protein
MTTYIENTGFTKTFVHDNHHKDINNSTEWNANYDGKRAKIKINMNTNGKKDKIRMKLSNKDLEQILSVPAINGPLEVRLQEDFLHNDYNNNNGIIDSRNQYVFLDNNELDIINALEKKEDQEHNNIGCYHPHSERKPEPVLFRMTIPYKKALLKSPFPAPCGCKSNICSHKLHLKNFKTNSSTPIYYTTTEKPRLSRREKHIRLKTPSPKTMRIQYITSSSDNGNNKTRKTRKTRKKHKNSHNKSNKKNKLTDFFKLY